jgi:hypothetical protein
MEQLHQAACKFYPLRGESCYRPRHLGSFVELSLLRPSALIGPQIRGRYETQFRRWWKDANALADSLRIWDLWVWSVLSGYLRKPEDKGVVHIKHLPGSDEKLSKNDFFEFD